MMKIRGVLDGFTNRMPQPVKLEEEVTETLRPANFQVAKVCV